MTCQVFEAKMEFFGRRSDSSWHKEDEVTAGPCIGEITCKCSHLAINSANVDVPCVVMFHLRLGYHGTCIMLCLLELSLSNRTMLEGIIKVHYCMIVLYIVFNSLASPCWLVM